MRTTLFSKLFHHIKWRLKILREIWIPQFVYASMLPPVVQSGPFKGMKYLRHSTGSVVLPKLIGTYEFELHPIIQSIDYKTYDQVIDIGAAEGYYAVGLSRFYQVKHMLAFEASKNGRRKLKKLARINKVFNISIKGKCEISTLKKNLQKGGRYLIIVDIEGYEKTLLSPKQIPELRQADILVELHPNQHANLEGIIRERFDETHIITKIPQKAEREIAPEVIIPERMQGKKDFLVDEFRGPQFWLFLKTKLPC